MKLMRSNKFKMIGMAYTQWLLQKNDVAEVNDVFSIVNVVGGVDVVL